MKKLFLSIPMLAFTIAASAQTSNAIRINQVGMYPSQEKIAVIEGGKVGQSFSIKNTSGKVVFSGKTSRVATSPWSGKVRAIANFTKFSTPGEYTFTSGGNSYKFSISPKALDNVANGVLNAYYIIRSGVPIESKYAGQYSRPLGHPDTTVYIHESAATALRPAGTVISSPGGWYDAGDYNKYIVNSAFTIGQILTVYELNKGFFAAQKLNIPENGNTTPDVLDEMMFNLRWMLTMQDPADGGVYHKLTTPNFESTIMPTDCHQKRYVVEKSTAATLDFAAVMAMAARIFKGNADYPDFSTVALAAAEKAWQWGKDHPNVYYDQNEMNKHFKPAVTTGAYDDTDTHDEFYWAATELYLLTGDSKYLDTAREYAPTAYSLPSWGNVSGLARFEWAMLDSKDPLVAESRKQIIDFSKAKLNEASKSCFQTPDGNVPEDFHWASLAENFATTGITYLYAYSLTKDRRYLTMAQEDADYILGKNATGYCYITGFGEKSPLHPHHRISTADGIAAPVPGLLVGGPNPGQQDKQYLYPNEPYPSNYPDESYVDSNASYASNEIAINWNAAAVGLFSWLAALENN